MNPHLWSRLQRFILINLLLFALNFAIKDPFFITCNDILEKLVIFLSWKKTSQYICNLPNSSYKRYEETKCSAYDTFPFSSASRLWIGMCWGQVLIPKHFWADCILPILLKHLDQGLISVLVWIHFSMTYHQNKTLKTSFKFGSH